MSSVIISALAVLSTACSQRDKKPRLAQSAVVGTWVSDSLGTGAAAAGRQFRLRMTADGLAELVAQAPGSATVVERGTWDGADSLIRVVVRGTTNGTHVQSLLFAMRGPTLGLTNYDSTKWGPQGLTLTRDVTERR